MRPFVVALASVALWCGLAGCGGSEPTPSATAGTDTTSTPASAPTTAAERCGGPQVASHQVAVTTDDGVELAAYAAGSGPRGVVLVHQFASQLCGWWPYAARLAGQGYHVLVFDDRCSGDSSCPHGSTGTDFVADTDTAVEALRTDGATKVAVVGASRGGAIALTTAADPPEAMVAVAGLSAALLDSVVGLPAHTAESAASGVRIPVLMAVAKNDDNVSVGATRRLFAELPASDKTLDVLPASAGHGWDLLRSADYQGWSDFAGTLEDFLARQL